MATYSLEKLVHELRAHKFVTNGVELTFELAQHTTFDHDKFGSIQCNTRCFDPAKTILSQFIDEVQIDLDRIRRVPWISREYALFPHSLCFQSAGWPVFCYGKKTIEIQKNVNS